MRVFRSTSRFAVASASVYSAVALDDDDDDDDGTLDSHLLSTFNHLNLFDSLLFAFQSIKSILKGKIVDAYCVTKTSFLHGLYSIANEIIEGEGRILFYAYFVVAFVAAVCLTIYLLVYSYLFVITFVVVVVFCLFVCLLGVN